MGRDEGRQRSRRSPSRDGGLEELALLIRILARVVVRTAGVLMAGEIIPAISVVMPVYNAQRYLAEAVESILDQTFRDFELIAIDDGSTDRSGEILREFSQRDPRVKVISRANTGLVGALIDGLRQSRAELIARMDADDISMPQRFEKQIAFMRENPRCVAVGSRVLLIDPLGSALETPDHKLTHAAIDAELMRGIGWALVHPVVLMRKSALDRVQGYRKQFEFNEDLDLFLQLAEIGEVANLPDVLLQYRQHLSSINHTRYEIQKRIKRQVVAEAYARRGLVMSADWSFDERKILSASQHYRKWGWKALKNGNVVAARKHAVEALKRSPWSLESWRLTACALRGR
jgi:glycosyltransferase involved in cell wall biosynthesis